MPKIISSADLRNQYLKISKLCHETNEPVFVTKNGKGDLVVMSMEAFDRLDKLVKLEAELEIGLRDIEQGRVVSYEEVLARAKATLK